MNTTETTSNGDPEFIALATVHQALRELEPDVQERVLSYVAKKLGLASHTSVPEPRNLPQERTVESVPTNGAAHTNSSDDGLEGISPIAKKWMTRNSLTAKQLGSIFSLGIDEIDLVAKSVPGTSKNSRTRSVVLLKGIAAYLSTGVARVTAEQIKEACVHYDAFDSPNHAKYLKGMGAEISGGKEGGYTLTPKGMAAATEMLQEMVASTGA